MPDFKNSRSRFKTVMLHETLSSNYFKWSEAAIGGDL